MQGGSIESRKRMLAGERIAIHCEFTRSNLGIHPNRSAITNNKQFAANCPPYVLSWGKHHHSGVGFGRPNIAKWVGPIELWLECYEWRIWRRVQL